MNSFFIFMNKTVALHTLGCKLNFAETSTIGKDFLANGFDIVDFNSPADVYVINTCTVTASADRECRQIVRRALRQNPSAFVLVTGCYAQLKPEEIASIDGVDAVVGSNEKFEIFSLIDSFQKNEVSCIFVSPTEELNNSFGIASSSDADERTRAYLKVQDGCDYKCSFCTIPLARGKSRSSNPEDVLRYFKQLIDEGYKEIILTGVNVGDYDFDGKNFYSLLTSLTELEGEYRIRISSIEANLLTDEIIRLVSSSGKMCKHFHIPLQSGSDKILKLMQRRYDTNFYKSLVQKIKSIDESIAIGVDVIVGFPGETEEDFLETYKYLNELPISYLHVFTYSERANTKAFSFDRVVDKFERKKRNNMLRILSEKKRNLFRKENFGKELEVIFESENKEGLMFGFSSNYLRVAQPFDLQEVNKLKKIIFDSSLPKFFSAIESNTLTK